MIAPAAASDSHAISVCICTMSRPDDLRKAIEALAQCQPTPSEVHVSDDSPAEDRRSEELCKAYPLVQYGRGPRRGLSANRNAVIARTGGDWLHFIDDDVVVPPDFYARALAKLPTIDAGSILAGSERNHNAQTGHVALVSPPYCGLWAYMRAPANEQPNCVVINATLFPRDLFDQALFDERFRYGWEESDITQHALALGKSLVVDPTLVVDHYPSPTNRSAYAPWKDASAVYAGLKRQAIYNRSIAKTTLFSVAGIARLLLNRFRHGGLRGAIASANGARLGVGFFFNYLATRSETLSGQ
jgi:GT2 family glycosyltransferase